MQLGFNLWAWTWCNISPRKSGTLGGGTGGTCGTRCPGTFAFLEPKEFLELVKRMGFHRFQGSTQVPHRFLHFSQATGSTGSRQVPWVQPGHWFHRVADRFLGFKHARVPQVPHRFLGFNHTTGFLGINRGTVGIVEGVNHQTVVLFNVPLSINQQWELWSLGNLVSHSSCFPIILEPCFLSFCLPSLCYYPFILALFILLSSIIISSYCPPLSLHLVSLRLVSHPFVAHYVIPIIIFSSCLPLSLHLDCPRASCLLASCSPTSLCLVSDHPFILSLFIFHHFVSRHTLSHHPCIPNSKKLLGSISGSRAAGISTRA